MGDHTDPDLVDALKRRDPAAWAHTYDEMAADVFGFIAHLLPTGASAAEEIHQDTWLAVLAGISTFDPARGELRGWIFGIARRRVALCLRKSGRTRSIELAEELALDDGALLPDDLLAEIERAEAVRAALAELGAEARWVLLGKYVHGRSVGELAREQGRTPKAVESQLSRARARMRSLLDWYFNNETTRKDAQQ